MYEKFIDMYFVDCEILAYLYNLVTFYNVDYHIMEYDFKCQLNPMEVTLRELHAFVWTERRYHNVIFDARSLYQDRDLYQNGNIIVGAASQV